MAALINVLDQKNITLDGEGTIDGQGKVYWDYYWNLRKEYEAKNLRWIVDYDAKRPRTILISNAKNVFLKNLNIQRAGFWTVQVLYSEFITVDGIKIRNNIGGHGPSTDGVDIDSSRWILVQNCDIDCNDDNFCLKAGRDCDECSKNGGGTVTFKPGKYLIGSLFIKEGVHFNVPENVTLLGSENIVDYPEIDTRVAGIEMKWPAALINVLDQKNITLDGEGTIDGQGKVYWDYYWNLRKEYEAKNLRWIVDYDAKRPRTILISNAKNVFLKNLNIQRAGFWTVQVLYSEFITVDGIKIRNNIGGHGPSTDGVDIDSSRWILVQNCDIDCNDDNFCLKAGRDWDGLRVNKPTEYVVVRNCIARQGAGLFTLGSETSGSIRHVYVSNIQGFGTKNGLNIKSATNRGGTVEDVYMENIKMESVGTFITISMNWNPAYSYSKLPEGYTEESLPPHWKKC